MGVLDGIDSPADLRALSPAQLDELAEEIREFLVAKVSRTGGHLGPNLGVVELTLALHRVFDSPEDVLLWDTGHQAYVHKMLTGRRDDFDHLRQEGGLSGLPVARRDPSTTSSRTRTPPPRCPTPTASPRPSSAPGRWTGATSWRSSATAR